VGSNNGLRPAQTAVRSCAADLRLRAALWRQWKTPRRRRAALIALRVSGELRNMAGSGRGPWHLARSKALSVGLSNAHFKSLGLPSLIEVR
jgi:RNA-directed DNA polymerase